MAPNMPRLTLARRTRASFLAAALLLAVVSLSLVDGLLWGVVAYERDTTVFYYPLTVWSRDQLHQGQFPLWAPQVFGGYPIFADGELGLACPPVLLALLALPPDRAFLLLRWLHVAVAALGGYLLARAWRLPYAAATLAGLVFALGSFLQAHIHHENIVRTAAWLPLALGLVERALRASGRARVGWTIAGALVVGLASLGLHTQLLAIDLLVLAAYGGFRWWAGPIARAGREWWRRGLALGAVLPGIALLGIALGAVQLVPLGELARSSLRGAGLPYGESAAYSLTPHGLAQLLFPFVFRDADGRQWGLWTHWESYLYVGLAPLVLAAIAVACVRRREVAAWALLGVGGLFLALGQYSPLNVHYLLSLVPGMGSLRAPGRFSVVVVLALAMLAGHGLAWLEYRSRVARVERWGVRPLVLGTIALPCVLAGVLGVAHLVLHAEPERARTLIEAAYLSLPRDAYPLTATDVYSGLLWATDVANPRVLGALVALLAIGCILFVWQCGRWPRARSWKGWPATIVLASAVDLLVFTWSIHPRESLQSLGRAPPAAQVVSQLAAEQTADGGPYRVLASPALRQISPNRLAPLALHEANGYTSLESRWHLDYLRRVLRVDDDLLDLWNVRYLLEPARYGSLASYKEVEYLTQHAVLHAPPHSALGAEIFRVPRDFEVSELRLVSALVNAVEVPQGSHVADIVLRGADGQALAVKHLLAGREVMEWGWDHPTIHSAVQHQRVEVAGLAFERGPDGQTVTRHLSYARLPLERPVAATALEIRNVLSRGELVVYGAALMDRAGASHQLFGHQKAKYREVYQDKEVRVLENTAAYPRAFVVPQARVAPSLASAFDQMAHQPFDPAREVVLAADTPPDDLGQARATAGRATSLELAEAIGALGPRQARIERYELHNVQVHVATPEAGFLVISDTYFPGWEAQVDGQPRPVLRGDLLFRAVQVPAGSHVVELRFQPRSVRVGLAMTIGALAVVLGALCVAAGLPHRRAPGRGAGPSDPGACAG
jgi:hypothetical protein